jgi:hypothetical protein
VGTGIIGFIEGAPKVSQLCSRLFRDICLWRWFSPAAPFYFGAAFAGVSSSTNPMANQETNLRKNSTPDKNGVQDLEKK